MHPDGIHPDLVRRFVADQRDAARAAVGARPAATYRRRQLPMCRGAADRGAADRGAADRTDTWCRLSTQTWTPPTRPPRAGLPVAAGATHGAARPVVAQNHRTFVRGGHCSARSSSSAASCQIALGLRTSAGLTSPFTRGRRSTEPIARNRSNSSRSFACEGGSTSLVGDGSDDGLELLEEEHIRECADCEYDLDPIRRIECAFGERSHRVGRLERRGCRGVRGHSYSRNSRIESETGLRRTEIRNPALYPGSQTPRRWRRRRAVS